MDPSSPTDYNNISSASVCDDDDYEDYEEELLREYDRDYDRGDHVLPVDDDVKEQSSNADYTDEDTSSHDDDDDEHDHEDNITSSEGSYDDDEHVDEGDDNDDHSHEDDSDGDSDDDDDDSDEDEWESFKKIYYVYPLSYIDKTHLEMGNKIILPLSALVELMDIGVEFPMLFEIKNPASGKTSHCGVLEFSAEEGVAIMPEWIMKNMSFEGGDVVNLESVTLDRATYVKLQPHSMKFLDIPNPRDVLEAAFSVGYSCLTVGDTIVIMHEGNKLYVDVVDAKPSNAVCIIETDVEVDFSPPLDYKEPVYAEQDIPVSEEEGPPKFVPFTGRARRLSEAEESVDDVRVNSTVELSKSMNNKLVTNAGEKLLAEGVESSNIGQTAKPFTGKSYRLMDS